MGFDRTGGSSETPEPYYVGRIMVVKKGSPAGPFRSSGEGPGRYANGCSDSVRWLDERDIRMSPKRFPVS